MPGLLVLSVCDGAQMVPGGYAPGLSPSSGLFGSDFLAVVRKLSSGSLLVCDVLHRIGHVGWWLGLVCRRLVPLFVCGLVYLLSGLFWVLLFF